MSAMPLLANAVDSHYLSDCDTKTGQRVYPPVQGAEMPDLLPEQLPPDPQEPTDRSVDINLQLSCWPPLGQATTVARDRHSVKFTLLLETAASLWLGSEPPEVHLWHNHNGEHDWSATPLSPTSVYSDELLMDQRTDRSRSRSWFVGELIGLPKHAHVVSFTFKFRFSPSDKWQWIKDLKGIQDGELCYLTDFRKHSSYDIAHFFHGISSDIKVERKAPDTDATQLWELTCPVNSATRQESGYQHHQLGQPRDCSRWFALVRLWSPWLAPRHGRGGKFKLDKDGVLLSFLRRDGLHVTVLGVSGLQNVMSTFLHDADSNVIIKGRNDGESTGTSRVLVAVAESFEVANAAVFYHARKIVAEHANGGRASSIEALTQDKAKAAWAEEWYDGLTYCTWNGLGQNLTASAIYRALDELSKNEINITNLIIDDNWQSLSQGDSQFKRGWSDFEANQTGFPDGMRATTTEIRTRHPNIKHIAVWHALLGYWGGIDPHGKIAAKYKTVEVEKEPGVAGGRFTVVAAEDAARLYDDFYSFLLDSGIDSVKTDAQFFLDMLLHAPDRRSMITEYQDAWTIAHLKYFSSRAISCMSQIPQAIFHSQLPRDRPRLLLRNSDDFFPDVDASHPWHIFCNAHNSLLTQHLNALPDWDMFQTSHDWASFHAAARCVSGGPIYFTDVPGQHNIELIRQMTAQSPQGKTVILRPHIVGKTVNAYNDYASQTILKVGTYVGMAHTGAGILGTFNVCQQTLAELVHLESFPGTEEGEYIIGSFCTGKLSLPMSRKSSESTFVGVTLRPKGWDVLTAYALRSFVVHGQTVSLGVLGLLGKMTGCAAVESCNMDVETNGRLRVGVSLKALGTLGLWLCDLEARDLKQDFVVIIAGKPIPFECVRRNEACAKVLEIDVEKAWKENGELAGWSNEVNVELFMS